MDALLTFFFVLIVFLFLVIALGIWVLWSSVIGAPWVPTSKAKIRMMLEMAQVTENDVVVDLGSGDGRILTVAAKEFSAKSIGIEADPLRVFWSRLAIRRRGLQNTVKVIWGNFFAQNLGDATVVTVYQSTDVNTQLKEKLLAELKPGTRVVSNAFRFDGWTPVKSTNKPAIYLYKI